jgi:hypothetical protein
MSLHLAAQHLAAKGRGPDDILVHMSKNELKSLQELAKSHGGNLTTNPDTGLPEAGFLSSLLPMVIGGALVASGVGAPLAAGLVGGGYGLATGSLSKGLMAGLGAYSGGSLAGGLAGMGEAAIGTDAFNAQNALSAGSASPELLQSSVSDAIGSASPWSKIGSGISQFGSNPAEALTGLGGGSAMKGAGMLASAAAPALAGSMLQQKPGDEYKPGGPNPYEYSYNHTTGQYTRQAPGYRDSLGTSPGIPRAMAGGGFMAELAGGGQSDLGDYSDGGRMLRGPGDGVSDSIPATIGGKQPARLADGEFVVPARIVSEIGNGSTEAGARKLYAMMDRVQSARKKSIGKDKVAVNSRAEKLLPA